MKSHILHKNQLFSLISSSNDFLVSKLPAGASIVFSTSAAPAALPFGVVCPGDLADQGVLILASLAQVFTEKLTRQNWK